MKDKVRYTQSNKHSSENPIHVSSQIIRKIFIYLQLVEVLRLTTAPLNGPSELQKPVSERRLAVVNVRDNGKVSDPLGRVLAQIYGILFAVLARLRGESIPQTKMFVI